MTDDIVKRATEALEGVTPGPMVPTKPLLDPMPRQDVRLPPRWPEAADITALRAEVERLKAERDESHSGWTDTIALLEKASARLDDYDAALKAAEAERDRLRELLRAFHPCVVGSGPSTDMRALHDAQMRVDAALKPDAKGGA